MRQCRHCGRRLVGPDGPASADILLVGDAPTRFDVKEGQLWTGDGGTILKVELRRVGISYNHCRSTNLWLHAKSNECKEHLDELMQEMQDKKFVLLMGADAVSYFTGMNVSDLSGLRVDTLPYAMEMLPPEPAVYAIFNPALALHDKMGEIRFGMEQFGGAIHGQGTNLRT